MFYRATGTYMTQAMQGPNTNSTVRPLQILRLMPFTAIRRNFLVLPLIDLPVLLQLSC